MQDLHVAEPTLFIVLGFPGAGKTFFSRQFAENSNAVHVNEDRIRYQIIAEPTYNPNEDKLIHQISDYMIETLMQAKQSIIIDGSNYMLNRRKELRELAKKYEFRTLVIWVQIDSDTAFDRAGNRDRRHIDDKYSYSLPQVTFERITKAFKRPHYEDYVVISGKHVFRNQLAAVVRKVKAPQIVSPNNLEPSITNPKTVLLGGRVDLKRRAIKPRIK